jgi:hypothetical protein
MLEDDFDGEDSDSFAPWQVYFLTLSDPADRERDFGLVKVGITRGAVERRIASLQTGNPYQIRCEATITSPQGRAVESWIHRTRDAKHLEWLRLPRTEIGVLVEEAKRESDRLVMIAEAEARWKTVPSNGRMRQPSLKEREVHREMQRLAEEAWPTAFQLSITLDRIALLAGKVWHIPGVVQVRRREAFKKFKEKLAKERFPDLVGQHTSERVQGRFYPQSLPNRATRLWAALRADAESLEGQCQELNCEILAEPERVAPEGARTGALAELHDRFLELISKKARLEIDKQELKARAVQMTEDWDGIEGLWTHKRTRRSKFDGKAFRTAHRDAAAACALAGEPFIQRHVFFSRSY